MSPLKKVTKVTGQSTVAVKRGVCVAGVCYIVTLECGHMLSTKTWRTGTKYPRPMIGESMRCKQCAPMARGEKS